MAMNDDAEKRAKQAKQMLADPIFNKVLDTVEEAFIGHWRRANDINTRESSWHALKSIELVKAELQSIADNLAVTAFNKRPR